ncbi:MAG: DUF6252 family protein [Flavobacteriaceae bacterium]
MKTTVKKIGLLFIATVISSFALSCSSSDDGGGGGSAAAGTITAKVNGTTFTSMEMVTFANWTPEYGTLTIQGNTTDKAIVLIMNGVDGPGTYDATSEVSGVFPVIATYMEIEGAASGNPVTTEWVAPYTDSGVVGWVKIAEIEEGGSVKGTFEFKGRNQDNDSDFRNVTNGSFNIELNAAGW